MDELVEHIIRAALRDTPADAIEREVMTKFGLAPDDAALALDRTYGGIVRAATQNPENCPARERDPVAWTSYRRATEHPFIIDRLYPEHS